MTDPTTPASPEEPTPASGPTPPAEPVVPPAAPAADPTANPYAAPAAAPAAGAAPAGTPVKQTLSLVSFILGIVGFLLSWFAGFGLLPGIAAVILGFMGKKREPQAPKWMWLVGIIGGFVAIALGLIVFIVSVILPIIFLASFGSYYSY